MVCVDCVCRLGGNSLLLRVATKAFRYDDKVRHTHRDPREIYSIEREIGGSRGTQGVDPLLLLKGTNQSLKTHFLLA